MRQVGDTLVWLGMITVVGAVVYFTPRVASYVALFGSSEHGRGCVTCRDIAFHPEDSAPVQTR
jgi:hypothetical protein